jgi:DNA replication protein DnaC
VTYDITTHTPSDAEWAYLQRVDPPLAQGHYDYCPTCNKLGVYFWRNQEHPCDCETQLILAQRYTLAGIAKKYWRLGWDDYVFALDPDIADYLQHVDGYLFNGMGLMLLGPNGIGKTMILSLILKDQVKRGYSCYATTFSNLADQIMAGWGKGDDARAAGLRFTDRFEYSDFLLLDEMGKEFKASNSITANTFDRVMRARLQANRPVLITTNYSIEQVVEGYGSSVFSMLCEQSVAVSMVNQDHRSLSQIRGRERSRTNERPPIR